MRNALLEQVSRILNQADGRVEEIALQITRAVNHLEHTASEVGKIGQQSKNLQTLIAQNYLLLDRSIENLQQRRQKTIAAFLGVCFSVWYWPYPGHISSIPPVRGS